MYTPYHPGTPEAPAPAPLPPDAYGIISRLLPANSRPSLFASCTAARDGVLSSCQAMQITLLDGLPSLHQRISLIQHARQKGLLKEQALSNITLKLLVGQLITASSLMQAVQVSACPILPLLSYDSRCSLMSGHVLDTLLPTPPCILSYIWCCLLIARSFRVCAPGLMKPASRWRILCLPSGPWC
jgi:hypothetical protein